MPRGCPSLIECANAFSRIVDLLDGEFDPNAEETTHDGILAEISNLATGFWQDIIDNQMPKKGNLDPNES